MTYKQWSFNFFITVILLNILVGILVVKSTIFVSYELQITIIGMMATFFLIAGVILGIMSYVKKENSDYKKKIGLFGNIFFLLLGIIISLFNV